MISHITIGVADVERAAKFYDAVMETLGYERRHTYPDAVGYGAPGKNPATPLWVMNPVNGEPPQAGNGWHAAFLAPSQEAVNKFFKAALANGGTSEGEPALRPHYHAEYYTAYVRDPEGNKIQAVNHGRFRDVV